MQARKSKQQCNQTLKCKNLKYINKRKTFWTSNHQLFFTKIKNKTKIIFVFENHRYQHEVELFTAANCRDRITTLWARPGNFFVVLQVLLLFFVLSTKQKAGSGNGKSQNVRVTGIVRRFKVARKKPAENLFPLTFPPFSCHSFVCK